ncbi:hypothetical protein F4559_004010 [Saccharothrix violaceirubra]|uniref:Uncharacterized protein n=1 Tax=Saccharothrix violaceirubra TaxID=413306 RepID=A0A7W7T4Z7_9PSEU|nr:hypothetical protein [Saccharothrix violaceirubra]
MTRHPLRAGRPTAPGGHAQDARRPRARHRDRPDRNDGRPMSRHAVHHERTPDTERTAPDSKTRPRDTGPARAGRQPEATR